MEHGDAGSANANYHLDLQKSTQDYSESAQHNRQQTHGAEPLEICPECAGAKLVYTFGGSSTCRGCNGTGKLHHA